MRMAHRQTPRSHRIPHLPWITGDTGFEVDPVTHFCLSTTLTEATVDLATLSAFTDFVPYDHASEVLLAHALSAITHPVTEQVLPRACTINPLSASTLRGRLNLPLEEMSPFRVLTTITSWRQGFCSLNAIS